MLLIFMLGSFIAKTLITALAVLASAYLLRGVIVKDFWTAVMIAVVLSLLNATLGFVVNLFTLWILSTIVTTLMLLLTSKFVKNFYIKNFWWGLGMAIIISIVTTFLKKIFSDFF